MKGFAQFVFLGLFLLCSISCGDDENSLSETEQIEKYLLENNLTAQRSSSGLYYIIEAAGSGVSPSNDSLIDIYIRGYTLDGNIFLSNFGGVPITLSLLDQSILRGLAEGLRLFNVGGKGTLILPSSLAFGQNGSGNGNVPPNSPVAYDIEILDIYTSESKLVENIADIEAYLESNNLTAQKTSSNLYYIIETEGDGEHPNSSSTVQVRYRGYLLDGTVFDETIDEETTSFSLSNLIPGWQEGIPLLSRGGRGKLFLPHTLGYGASPPSSSPIEPYGVIAFDIELVDF